MTVPVAPAAGEPIAEAWGDVVHDAVVAMDFQAGKFTASLPSSGTRFDTTVTFPRPFAGEPFVTAMALAGAVHIASGIGLATANSVGIGIFRRDGAVLSATSVTVYWQAYGPRA